MIRRSSIGLAALLAIVVCLSPARAQTPSLLDACADSADVGAYRRCALWVEGARVRRGADGAVVAKPGLLHPARLARVVAGDSARAQATLYERNARRSTVLGVTSGALLVAAWAVAASYDCAPVEFGPCSNTDDNYGIAAGLLVIGSGVTLLASIPFTIRATRAMARAVWWHNARFAR